MYENRYFMLIISQNGFYELVETFRDNLFLGIHIVDILEYCLSKCSKCVSQYAPYSQYHNMHVQNKIINW